MLSKLLSTVSEIEDSYTESDTDYDLSFESFGKENSSTNEEEESSQEDSQISTLNFQNQEDMGLETIKNALQTNIFEENQSKPCLFCHKNEEFPPVVTRCAGKCFHIECCKCANCKKQITSPSASVIGENPFTLLCNECADELEEETILCPVCHQNIDEDDNTEALLSRYVVHSSCLHCCACSRTRKDVSSFNVLTYNNKDFCLCKDCFDFITMSKIPEACITGRFPADIMEEKRYRCKSCNENLKGRFFFFYNQTLLCKSCASLEE